MNGLKEKNLSAAKIRLTLKSNNKKFFYELRKPVEDIIKMYITFHFLKQETNENIKL